MEQERLSINAALEQFEKEWGLERGIRLPKVQIPNKSTVLMQAHGRKFR